MTSNNRLQDDSLSAELRRLQEQVRCLLQKLEEENTRLQQKFERAEAERRDTLIACQEDQKRWQREQRAQVLNLLRKMGENRIFILDMIEMLEESGYDFSSRDVLAEFKRWIRDVSGQRLSRFPTEDEAPGGYITLAADELTAPHRGFTVGNERPFADEQDQVRFRVIRQGWRLGSEILHPARLSAFGMEESTITEANEEA